MLSVGMPGQHAAYAGTRPFLFTEHLINRSIRTTQLDAGVISLGNPLSVWTPRHAMTTYVGVLFEQQSSLDRPNASDVLVGNGNDQSLAVRSPRKILNPRNRRFPRQQRDKIHRTSIKDSYMPVAVACCEIVTIRTVVGSECNAASPLRIDVPTSDRRELGWPLHDSRQDIATDNRVSRIMPALTKPRWWRSLIPSAESP